MHRFRFSLLAMFGFVAVVAVACAALARPSQLWLVVVSASSLGCLFYAVLAAAYGRNARRAFWLGFAVVGWGYIVLEWASAAGLPFSAPTAFVTDRLQTLLHAQATLPTPDYASWSKTPPGAPVPVVEDGVAPETGAIAKPSAAGPGMIMLGEPGGVVPKTQIIFASPDGMVVAWEVAPGQFDSEPLTCPGRSNFPQGALYRLKLTDIPGHEGLELFPTLEIGPTLPRTEAYVAHNAVPLQFTEEDFDQVMSGKCVTKVIYLPDPDFQELALAGIDTLVSTRLDPGVDPIIEADRRGAILAIVRIGNKDLQVGDDEATFPSWSLPGAAASQYAIPNGATYLSVQPSVTVDFEAFGQIAMWLWSPLLGFAGGLVALRLYHQRERQDGQRAATG